jgi:TPR repeat protein
MGFNSENLKKYTSPAMYNFNSIEWEKEQTFNFGMILLRLFVPKVDKEVDVNQNNYQIMQKALDNVLTRLVGISSPWVNQVLRFLLVADPFKRQNFGEASKFMSNLDKSNLSPLSPNPGTYEMQPMLAPKLPYSPFGEPYSSSPSPAFNTQPPAIIDINEEDLMIEIEMNKPQNEKGEDEKDEDPQDFINKADKHYHGLGAIPVDYKQAFSLYLKAAAKDNAEAQYNIGVMFAKGHGVHMNKQKAMEWYLKASHKGYGPAQCNIGYFYEIGEAVPMDKQKAMEWYLMAAEQGTGSGLAQSNIGRLYSQGMGYITANKAKAMEWYLKAANQGVPAAQYNIGCLYHYGEGVLVDTKKAMEWYLKAANSGYPPAQCNIGILYSNGTVEFPKDKSKAMEWYMKAATRNNMYAQCNIGALYYKGDGVVSDEKLALEWFLKAAEQGHAEAQYYVGVFYDNGTGITANKSVALEWYLKATEQGHFLARERYEYLSRMMV